MNAEDKALAIAARIADGSAIDWPVTADTAGDDVIDELKTIEALATLHRSPLDSLIDPAPDVSRWGPLTILGPIGEGRFGQVFRAWDARLQRQVALKVLHAPASEASASPSHAIDEARLLARVRHPNVLTIYGAEALDGQVGIWTEFIEGRTLEEVLAERGPMPPEEVAAIGVDLCRALTAVHDAGLLHRDIKAQNVMRETGGRIVLMDFGTGHDLEVVPTRAGDMSGTPLYLAPEIFADGTATVASDIYALAVLLHRLLTGLYPVEGRTLDDVRAEHVARRRTHVNSSKTALTAAIERGLSVDPALRFQSAAAMEQALLESAEVAGSGIRPNPPPTGDRMWRRAGILGLAALLTLGVWAAVSLMPSPTATGIAMRELRMPDDADGLGTISEDGRLVSYTGRDGSLKLLEIETGKTHGVFSAAGTRVTGRTVFRKITDSLVFGVTEAACECMTLHEAPLRNGASKRLLAGTRFRTISPLGASRDGMRILVEAARGAEAVELGIVQLDVGTYWRLLPQPLNMQDATLSPDGRYVAYDRPSERPDFDANIYVTSVESGETHAVADGAADESIPFWTPDGRALLYVSDATGGRGLWSIDIASGKPAGAPKLVLRDMGLFVPMSLAAANGTLLYWRAPVLDIETAPFDLARGVLTGSPQKLPVRQFGVNSFPVWSNDGESIVYAAERRVLGPVRSRIVVHSLRDRAEREIRVPVNGPLEPAWSPDSRFLLIRGPGSLDAVRGARLIDAVTGNIVAVYPYPGMQGVRWSPDGRGFFFGSDAGIHRVEVATRHTTAVRIDGGWSPGQLAISPDGTSIAAAAADGERRAILLVPSAGGTPRILHTPPPGTHAWIVWDWTPDGTRLLVVRPLPNEKSRRAQLITMSVRDGTIASTGLQGEDLVQFRISPDGRQIAYRTGANRRTVWLLERFLPGAR